jgi:hypothetical protein
MTHDEWKVPFEGKVTGTWNLHNALQHVELDFFVLFSSICGLSGNSGQANYAAANTFLDAFVQYRRSQGLAASTLDIGAVDEIGCLAEDPKLLRQARLTATYLVPEADLIDTLQVAIMQSHSQDNRGGYSLGSSVLGVGMSPAKGGGQGSDSSLPPQYWEAPDARFRAYKNLQSAVKAKEAGEVDDLRECMNEIEKNPTLLHQAQTLVRIGAEIGRLVATYVSNGQEMTNEEIANSPIDSLMSIEIRNWTRRRMNIDVSLPEISKAGTVGGLSKLAVEKLKAKYIPQDTKESSSDTDGLPPSS